MNNKIYFPVLLAVIALGGEANAANKSKAVPQQVKLLPKQLLLSGSKQTARVLVLGKMSDGKSVDLTRDVTFSVSPKNIIEVSENGVVTPLANGKATIRVRVGKLEVTNSVVVQSFENPRPVDFRTEVIGALSRGGCNSGACHGSPQGKNGFRLSLRGFQPELDLMTLTRESFGRRTNPTDPDSSLILRKASGKVPHQGGRRFKGTEPAFHVLRDWIAQGVQDSPEKVVLEKLEVLPKVRYLHTTNPKQQLIVRAHFGNGKIRDVTHLTAFSSSDEESAIVSQNGLVEFHRTSEVAILVRYLDEIVSVPRTYVKHDPKYSLARMEAANYIDRAVFSKYRELQLRPSPLAVDATFLRRVYLDTIGVMPSVSESRDFLASTDSNKRTKLIDTLLNREEFGYFWALKWADVMRGNRELISQRGVHVLHRYLVQQFSEDRPFDQFARQILTSKGNTIHSPAANFYRISQTPELAAESMAQLFLGVRIQCAKCHNHPYENITQDDYYGFAAFFARVKLKSQRFGLDDQVVYVASSGEVKHPRNDEVQPPVAFGAQSENVDATDRRSVLADWLTSPDNPYFTKSTVNRIWYHLLGRGIVEPIDDFRESNPPANAELLDGLAAEFVRSGYRMKPVIRSILNSKTYQLGAQPVKQSAQSGSEEKYFTRSIVKMLSAEQILDAIATATGVPEQFPNYPLGTRAIEIAEGQIDHNFLKAFSKPIRDMACECARETDPSLNQVIHLLNNPSILQKLAEPTGNLARWIASEKTTAEIVELVYLATLNRNPTKSETDLVLKHIAAFTDRSEGLRDLQHALMNSNEFLLRH